MIAWLKTLTASHAIFKNIEHHALHGDVVVVPDAPLNIYSGKPIWEFFELVLGRYHKYGGGCYYDRVKVIMDRLEAEIEESSHTQHN